jgi:hypothetical protein
VSNRANTGRRREKRGGEERRGEERGLGMHVQWLLVAGVMRGVACALRSADPAMTCLPRSLRL